MSAGDIAWLREMAAAALRHLDQAGEVRVQVVGDAAMSAAHVESLVVAGLILGGAVDCAVREAAERGRAVVLAADACAAETYTLHDCVCTQLGGGAVRVRSTDAVLALLT